MTGRAAALEGAAIGTAVGDALGLPMEGMSPASARVHYPGPPRNRFISRFGVLSDDTEHTYLVLLMHPSAHDDPDRFGRRLSLALRFWLLSLPLGIGFGTLRALVRSWVGFGPRRSGVRSAGNGPAMRSAVLGVLHASDATAIDRFVEASTLLTHTDVRALEGAKAVAHCAALACTGAAVPPGQALAILERHCQHPAWRAVLEAFRHAESSGLSTRGFAQALGLEDGVPGYIVYSVPIALYAWSRHPESFREAVTEAIEAGGDTDSVAAVTGALVGARVGVEGIPAAWIDGIRDWPISLTRLRTAARNASAGLPTTNCWHLLALPLRNLVLLPVVVSHVLWHWVPDRVAAWWASSS